MLMFYWSIKKIKHDATIVVVSVCFSLSLDPLSNLQQHMQCYRKRSNTEVKGQEPN